MALECAIDLAMVKLRVKYAGTLGATSAYGDYMKSWAATQSWNGSIDSKKTIMKAACAAVPVTVPATAAMQDIEYLYWKNVSI
jgi:hypothetical protein